MHAAAIEKLISHYEERFPSSSYDYSKITSDTKKIIASLDEIADEMNSLFAAKDYDREKFYRLYVEALRIIFGENNKKYLELAKDLEEEFGKKEKKE